MDGERHERRDHAVGGAGMLARRESTLDLREARKRLGPVRLRLDTPGARPLEATLGPGLELVVGSGTAADVRVADRTVSARHCRVEHVGDAITVSDLESKNGLRVASARVAHASLGIGASAEMGRTTLLVLAPPATLPEEELNGPPLADLVGESLPMRTLAAMVRRVAPLRLPVLVRGETGTGKDLVASAVHAESLRDKKPFVALNAAAIARDLAESELFGHERGAFTGALRDRRGAFREASGGTLFLDEIGSISLEVQAKLLRVVESGVVRPLGSEATTAVDVRLIAATCEPLEVMVHEGRFRADLLERLAVCVLKVPPLRERPEDIPALARHLLRSSEVGPRDLTAEAVAILKTQRWLGNVRELRNVVVQAAVRAGREIGAEHVAAVLAERSAKKRISAGEAVRIFHEEGCNVSAAARRAEIPRTTMRDLLHSAGVRGRG